MDNKGFWYLVLQNSTLDSTGYPEYQHEQSADNNQQAVFSGRLTALTSPAQLGPTQPEMPLPIYGEHVARQQPLTDFCITTNTAVQPFNAVLKAPENPFLATVNADDPTTATQQLNIGSTGSLPWEDVDPFVALANYQPLSFGESSFEQNSALPRSGTHQNLDYGLKLLADVVLADANRLLHEAGAATEIPLQPPKRKKRRRRRSSLPEGWVIFTNSEERPYQCGFPNCNKAYKKTTHLKAHIFSHTGISNYRCTYAECGDNTYFCDKSQFDRHIMARHSVEKPFHCKFCDHKANRKDNLRSHLLNRHGIKM